MSVIFEVVKKGKVMRADRLLSMLRHLQINKKMTAKQLAEELEVSQRTIYRDIDALSAMKVPIYTEGGPGGGIFLDKNYRVSLVGFNQDEIRALFLFSNNQPLQMLGGEDAQQTAIDKLQASLPFSFQEEIRFLQQRIFIDGSQWYGQIESEDLFQALLHATKVNRQISIKYRTANGQSLNRVVSPYGLVAKANIWYLIALHDEIHFRTYRTSRIQNVQLTDATFERPVDFDLRSHWQITSEKFIDNIPIYVVKLHVNQHAQQFIYRYAEQYIQHESDDQVELWFEAREQALMLILALGDGFEILEPIELTSLVQTHINHLLSHLS